MSVSVVMPVLNSADVIGDQLDALTGQDFEDPWELVVADNGCTDGTIEIAMGYAESLDIRIVDASARRGDVAARNIAVADTGRELIVFCDSDDVVGPRWLSGHVAELADVDVSVGPYDMRVDMASPDGGIHAAVPMHGIYGYLPYGLSANMGVRRPVFESLDGFDEEYRTGYDVEFCWRAQVLGYRLGYADGAMVTKRKRPDAAGAWRQHKAFGIADVHLYTSHRDNGMPRSASKVLTAYGWLLLHVGYLFDERRRLTWIGVAAQRAGRIAGSFRYRTVFL